MSKTIKISEATYQQLVERKRGMDTFDQVIQRLLIQPKASPPDKRFYKPEE